MYKCVCGQKFSMKSSAEFHARNCFQAKREMEKRSTSRRITEDEGIDLIDVALTVAAVTSLFDNDSGSSSSSDSFSGGGGDFGGGGADSNW